MTPIEPKAIDGIEMTLKTKKWQEELIFVIAMWLLSRSVIVVAIQIIAPLSHISPIVHSDVLPLDFHPNFIPKSGWELFSHWDGAWYRQIATEGYDYAKDGKYHSVAFFPLFPLISRGVMTFGFSFEVAATLVNNLAFFGALFVLYRWAVERYDVNTARWATAVLAWFPLSLYGTVIYTEGLFLLLTTAALRAFDNYQYGRAALWGAMATATRSTGLMLVPAFLIVAAKERRPIIAYVAGIAATVGLLLFSLYCAIRFADPLAFVHVQQAWQHPTWWMVFKKALKFDQENLMRVVTFWGGGYLLWYFRAKLPAIAVAYGFCSMAMPLVAGSLSSISRYAYGIVSLSLALGFVLANRPRWGYAAMGLFSVLLMSYAVHFAWWYWVA